MEGGLPHLGRKLMTARNSPILVLAAVKIVQDEAEAIREVAAVSCFYDANRKAVYPMSMSMSAAASVYSPLSSLEVDARVGKFRKIIDAFEAGQQDERIRVVINSLRLEQIDNDDYRRGWYLWSVRSD